MWPLFTFTYFRQSLRAKGRRKGAPQRPHRRLQIAQRLDKQPVSTGCDNPPRQTQSPLMIPPLQTLSPIDIQTPRRYASAVPFLRKKRRFLRVPHPSSHNPIFTIPPSRARSPQVLPKTSGELRDLLCKRLRTDVPAGFRPAALSAETLAVGSASSAHADD